MNVVEDFVMVLYRQTGIEKYHHFLLSVLFQKREQKLESHLARTHQVALL